MAELPSGAIFDGYRVLRKIGVGGMGKVYEAEHLSLGRKVALKVLLPRYARDQDALRRFLSEAKVVNLIKHQSIVNIYDISTAPSGDFYFVMEMLEGQDLSQFLQKTPTLNEGLALAIFLQIGRALWAAHQKGVIHRDLKPANVFLVPKDDHEISAKLLDFGLAKLQGEATKGPDKGPLLGTPHYMAPEYIRGAEPNPATDQYAFGVMLYRSLTGVRPFDGKDPVEVFRKQLNDTPQDPQLLVPELRTELCQLIMRTLQKEHERRFANMGEVVEILASLVGSAPEVEVVQESPAPPKRSRRAIIGAILAGAFALSAAGGWFLLRDEGPGPSIDYQASLEAELKGCSPEERAQVIAALGRIQKRGVVALLVQQAKESDLQLRQAAIIALGQQQDPSAKDALIEIWKNTKNIDVAAALLPFGDSSAEIFLKAALGDPARRINAAYALTNANVAGAERVLREAIERGLLSPEFSIAVAKALLATDPELAKKTLQAAVDRDDAMSARAALALAQSGDEAAKAWLSDKMAQSLPAALALADLGDERAIPRLLSALSSAQEEKSSALLALVGLSAQKKLAATPQLNRAIEPLRKDPSALVRCGASLFFWSSAL